MMWIFWMLIPLINIIIPLLFGLLDNLSQQIQVISPGLSSSIFNFADSSILGNTWIISLIATVILAAVSFIHVDSFHKQYNIIGIFCIISIIFSFVIINELF